MTAQQHTRIDMTRHTLVIIEGAGPGRKIHQPCSPLQRSLPVGTMDATVAAIVAGIGFGWLPIYRIQHEIERGELVPLQLPIGGVREVRLSLVWKDTGSSHSELSVLAELLGRGRGVDVI
ncbi:MAG: LysR substrate-binding domain-containing protein [Bryobacteraceae bacterium]